ncbi:MAG: addiction module protein [bacterium]
MLAIEDEIANQIQVLSDIQKMSLVDRILIQLDRPDPSIDSAWAQEARQRWNAYKSGQAETVSYNEVMAKYQRQ